MRLGKFRSAEQFGYQAGKQTFIERLRSGDPSALRDLFQSQGKRALALALRITGDAGAAEDAVQEAFAQLWARAEQIEPAGGRIESLLMTIVHRRAIDLVRRRKHMTALRLPDPELLEEVDDQAMAMLDRVEENLSSTSLRAELRAALEALPPEQKTVVELAYFGERSLQEIARLECLPLGTVKSRLRLAMAKLSAAMVSRAGR